MPDGEAQLIAAIKSMSDKQFARFAEIVMRDLLRQPQPSGPKDVVGLYSSREMREEYATPTRPYPQKKALKG